MRGVIVTPMQKTKAAVIFSAVALLCASCGSFLPDKFWYPVESDAPPPKKEQKAEAPKPAPVAEKPVQVAKAEEPPAPLEEGDAVIFGDAPKAKDAPSVAAPAAAAPAATSPSPKGPAPEKMEQRANPLAMIMPAPDQKEVPPPPVEARESSLGVNALARTFATPYDQGWEKTIEVLLAAPLTVIDKSSGVMITEWMVQQRVGGGMSLGLFGDGQRVIRYKYAVKVYDRDGKTEVVVIPYTQYTEGHQWLDAKPRRMISEHLMRLIVAKMEGK